MFRNKDIFCRPSVCLTWLAVFLLAFDACSAGGVLRRFIRCHWVPAASRCSVVPACPVVVETCTPVSYSTPIYSAPVAYETANCPPPTCHDCNVTACDGMCGDYSDACGGGGVIVNECAGVVDYAYSDCCTGAAVSEGYIYGGVTVDGGEVISEGAIVKEGEVDGSVVSEKSIVDEGTPLNEGTVVDHTESATEPSPRATTVDPMPADTSPPANFVEDDLAPMPTRESDPVPGDDLTDDLFGDEAPAASVPDEPALEEGDLFGDEPSTEPADTDDGLDDLFGDEPPAQPADTDDGLDDLFGDDTPATPVEDDLPEDDSFPADTMPDDVVPADDEMPMDDGGLEDLFGDDPAGEAASDDGDDGLNDLFGDEPADGAPADGGLEDLFDEGADAESDDDLDDLFSGQQSPDQKATRTISFVSNRMPMRAWWDNTGKYRTIGSLLTIGDDYIRLAKANGRTCTVPFHRLSEADLKYVLTQVEQHDKAIKVAAK